MWVALSFAACVGVFTWIAGDLAKVLARKAQFSNKGVSTAGLFAALGVALFGIFGSIQYLYSAGFTNFIMAVAVVAATSYLSAKKPESFGWFVLPLGALATVGLWTPLVVALVPAGIVIAIKLIRVKIWWGILWLVGVSAVALVTLISQADAVLGASESESTGDFNEALSSVGVGMTGFNLTLAMFAPLIAVFIGINLWRRGSRVLALLLSAPVILAAGLALIFVVGADASDVSRLTSYYVLKSLNASLLLLIPVLAALGAIGLVLVVRHLGKLNAVFISITAFVIGASTFGFIGFNANQLAANFDAAPGIAVALERDKWINEPETGERIVQEARVAQQNPDFTPIAWQGVGTLENLWVLALTNVASS
jgi:MFS family permease